MYPRLIHQGMDLSKGGRRVCPAQFNVAETPLTIEQPIEQLVGEEVSSHVCSLLPAIRTDVLIISQARAP